MANYAQWRKCDFQVHTPRDPNWTGQRPLGRGDIDAQTGQPRSDAEIETSRAQWAEAFLDTCVARGLQAIAITDHHEMVMYPYVRTVALARRSADPAFDLWVFPGMELTAVGGTQCLLIFDADLSDDWRRQAQGKLGIAYANVDERAGKGSKVEQLKQPYPDIGKCLDELQGLRGKYIVLPNVSEGGRYTALTDGGHAEFLRMPYVGGYLDCKQTIETLGSKNRKRLSGTDKAWSLREVYPLPTSDCRTSDYATLGKNETWIKLAEPTAEAIRQAFLGHKSRIHLGSPFTPSPAIVKVEISGSTILKAGTAELSAELNSVIGGRGSGKSSLLEYLAYALGRSCHDTPRPQYSGSERMKALVADTLISPAGQISITVRQDNAEFIVTRSASNAHAPQIRYPNGVTSPISVKELRSLFPAVVYSQGELAEIGKRASARAELSELLQFVSATYKIEDDQIAAETVKRKQSVRLALQALIAYWEKQAEQHKLTAARDTVRLRVEALEKTLPKLSEEDQKIVDLYSKADEFEATRLLATHHSDELIKLLSDAETDQSAATDLPAGLPETSEIRRLYAALVQTFGSGISDLQKLTAPLRAELSTAEANWAAHLGEMRKARDAVLSKIGAHKTVTDQIIKLRENLSSQTQKLTELEAAIAAVGDPADDLRLALDSLKDINRTRGARTQDWAREIERLSSNKIRAEVFVEGDKTELTEAVDAAAAKTGSQQSTRMQAWDTYSAAYDDAGIIQLLRAECLSILHWRLVGAARGDDQPHCQLLWKFIGDTENIRSTFVRLLDASRLETLSTALARPQIALFYCDGPREVTFDKASEGQRASALLFMLLEQEGGPLIIDQPEGDLDNKIIAELTEKLHGAKQRRQLIFASHNANIVVNGSSELVACLDVVGDGSRTISSSGAIDSPEICTVITSIMEGGEKAFKDRYDKYGY